LAHVSRIAGQSHKPSESNILKVIHNLGDLGADGLMVITIDNIKYGLRTRIERIRLRVGSTDYVLGT
jgi:hypothetical protein